MRFLTHSVVIQLLLGALLKFFLPAAGGVESYLAWSTFSVVGLFITVGLQIHPEKFSKNLKLCLTLVAVTTIFPMLAFYFLATAFGYSFLHSLTISVVLVTTGTGVTIQTLSNLGKLHTVPGQFLTLVSALDDVPAAIIMGLLLMNVPATGPEKPFPVFLLLTSLSLLILIKAAVHRDFPRKPLFLSILLLAFGLSFSRMLEGYHVSLVMGGLIAGGILGFLFRDHLHVTEGLLEKMLKPFLFFYMIYIGMKLSPSILGDRKLVIFSVLLIVIAIATKWLSTYFLVRKETALLPKVIAWGMVPRGIPGFAFATAALGAGLITEETFTVLVLIVSVTTWIGLLGLEFELRNDDRKSNGIG